MLRFLVALIFLVAPSAVGAQTTSFAPLKCYGGDHVRESMAKQYKEAPIARGITPNNLMVEILTSEDGSTWTLHIVHPGGGSCVVATGNAWQGVPFRLPDTAS